MQLKILTHEGKEYDVSEEIYDAASLNEKLNDNQVNTVLIGGLILSRITIKEVIPITE
jgi:hypothetical protein